MEDASSGGRDKDEMGPVSQFHCAEGVVLFTLDTSLVAPLLLRKKIKL